MPIKGKFTIDVYSCEVFIYINDSITKAINYRANKEGGKKIDFDPAGYTYRPGESIGQYYLFFRSIYLEPNTINHEKSHLVDWILQDRSIKANGEQRAYLDGLVSEKFNSFFKRRKIKIK